MYQQNLPKSTYSYTSASTYVHAHIQYNLLKFYYERNLDMVKVIINFVIWEFRLWDITE